MKTPDKIFVSSDPFGFMNGYDTEHHPPQGEEYIRKDALLEWANEHKRAIETHGDERDAYSRGEYSVLNFLIDKLNSM